MVKNVKSKYNFFDYYGFLLITMFLYIRLIMMFIFISLLCSCIHIKVFRTAQDDFLVKCLYI